VNTVANLVQSSRALLNGNTLFFAQALHGSLVLLLHHLNLFTELIALLTGLFGGEGLTSSDTGQFARPFAGSVRSLVADSILVALLLCGECAQAIHLSTFRGIGPSCLLPLVLSLSLSLALPLA
jgi:hypothetical protein